MYQISNPKTQIWNQIVT